jgi:hypothetical protein
LNMKELGKIDWQCWINICGKKENKTSCTRLRRIWYFYIDYSYRDSSCTVSGPGMLLVNLHVPNLCGLKRFKSGYRPSSCLSPKLVGLGYFGRPSLSTKLSIKWGRNTQGLQRSKRYPLAGVS